MSVRLTAASSQDLHNTPNVFNQNADYTWSGWLYWPTTLAGTVLRVGSSIGAGLPNTDAIQFQGSGLRIIAYDATGTAIDFNDGANLATGTWYYVTMRRSGTDLHIYVDGVSYVNITAAVTGRLSATLMTLGSRQGSDQFADARFAYSRIQTSALTTGQITTERTSPTAVVSAVSDEPLTSASALGIWTATGTPTTEADPPAVVLGGKVTTDTAHSPEHQALVAM